jgi:hypothetical protein
VNTDEQGRTSTSTDIPADYGLERTMVGNGDCGERWEGA